MSFNERLRKNLKENGTAAAKKWEKVRSENAKKFNADEYMEAEKCVEEFHKKRSMLNA